MIRTILAGLLAISIVTPLRAADTQDKGAKELALHRLSQAEDAARDIQDPQAKAAALSRLAVGYAQAGDMDSAKDIASRLGRTDRLGVTGIIVGIQAQQGDFAGAVATARATKDDQARFNQLCSVVNVWAHTDISAARKLAAEIPETQHSRAFHYIGIQQALNGDVEGAENTCSVIKDVNYKKDMVPYIQAAKVLANGPDYAAAAAKMGVDLSSLPLGRFVEARLKEGKLADAEPIAELQSAEHRTSNYIDIAEYLADHGQKTGAQEYVEKALSNLENSDGSDAGVNAMTKGSHYLSIATLQIRLGDIDAGIKNARLAEQIGGSDALGLFNGMGGKTVVIGLLAQAGRMDEAVKLATQPDGTILPAAVPVLAGAYAAQGKDEEAKKLLEGQGPQQRFETNLAMALDQVQKSTTQPQGK